MDHENKVARLALVGPETLEKIHEEEKNTAPEYLHSYEINLWIFSYLL